MSKAKHTTWKSKRISDDLFFVKDMDGNTVATVWDTKPNIDGSANARLIAEAPIMYKTLKELSDNPSFSGHLPTTRIKVLGLLKKIEG